MDEIEDSASLREYPIYRTVCVICSDDITLKSRVQVVVIQSILILRLSAVPECRMLFRTRCDIECRTTHRIHPLGMRISGNPEIFPPVFSPVEFWKDQGWCVSSKPDNLGQESGGLGRAHHPRLEESTVLFQESCPPASTNELPAGCSHAVRKEHFNLTPPFCRVENTHGQRVVQCSVTT